MKSFKLLFVSLFLGSLSANSELNLDLKEYEIEIIIFKHTNVLTDEKFDEEFGKAIGADAYCRDAAVAVETAKEFMAKKHNQLSM